ncbi:hypothetical protein GCM10008910_31390 [Faecalicatena orotica]|uniref:Uncharacterized protein n=1 Tax=Faecalicatena orotica TaxID=1544 RepID=A0A2Y9BMB5_9FIRM|nr:hypothetical protein [Faecalicatena orotica]PWJ22680.1 hypothetical protein A8806_11720 [Faecalicatena orotica]SSA58123.1 hypothetical protein SAMN05216536_11720 [Faecalicatena orotica]
MTVEEYEEATSQLAIEDLAAFINANPEVAEEWTQLEIKKVEDIQLNLTEEDYERMRRKLFERIRIYEFLTSIFEGV